MDFPPRFHRRIAIVFLVTCLTVIAAPRARAASFSDYVATPFQSVATTFETVFAKLIALVEPQHTVTISPAPVTPWHAVGKSQTAAAFNAAASVEVQPARPIAPRPIADSSRKSVSQNVDVAALGGVVLGTSTTDGVVTHAELATAINQATNALRSLIYQNESAPNSAMGTGGFTNEIAASNKIDQLSGTTINNPTITGGTVSGATLSGNSLSAGASTLGATSIAGGLTVTGGGVFDNATSTNAFVTNLSALNGLITNATTTNLYAAAAVIPSFTATNATTSAFAVTGSGYFAGNVGIGTTSPPVPLTIDSTSANGTIFRLSNASTGGHIFDLLSTGSANTGGAGRLDIFDRTAGLARLSIASNGNVGVGTTSPQYPLDVSGDINSWGNYRYDGTNFIIASSSTGSTFVGLGAGNTTATGLYNTAFGYYAGAHLTAPGPGAGNQGINTLIGYQAGANITSGVEITSVGYDAGFSYTGNSALGAEDGNDTFVGSLAGLNETGTGNTYLGQKAGINMASTSDTANVFIGEHAGMTWIYGASNVIIGGSGGNNTTGNTGSGNVIVAPGSSTGTNMGDKEENTFLGHNAGLLAATSTNNTFLGSSAGYHNFTGAYNTYVGYSAGVSALGSNNVALGYFAGASASSSNGVYVGYGAGQNASTNYGTTIIGSYAGYLLSTGGNAVIIGDSAGKNLTTQANNTVVGSTAGFNLTSNSNTVIGQRSFYNASSGGNNTGLGVEAGVGVTSGGSNTVLGYQAGHGITAGSNNIIIGAESDAPIFTGSQQLNIGNVLYGTGLYNGSLGPSAAPVSSGNLGVGTTSPLAKLDVAGGNNVTVPLFQLSSVASYATTTEFVVNNNGSATLAGALTQSSDQRLKTNILSLDASSSLSAINALNPVTFNWIDPASGVTPQLGFIAQQVQSVFPNLVSTTSATALTPGGTLGLNYIGLISPIVAAIQALDKEIASLASTVAGFAQSLTTQRLCIGGNAGDPNPVCITKAQLAALLAGDSQPSVQISEPTPPTISGTSTPPTIDIQGDNPAIVQVGASYADLGATITGPAADLNLGIKTFVNGLFVSNIVLDTSAAATDTIDYVATDSQGLTSTSTRTVVVQAANDNGGATTTVATSTVQ